MHAQKLFLCFWPGLAWPSVAEFHFNRIAIKLAALSA